jgi:diguanylate cyclase (GGDEF)-like protein
VLAQTAEASQADLFTPEGRDASPALAASLRRLADGEFFAYFERPPAGSRTDASELVCRKAEEVVSGARAVIRAEVWLGKDAIGFAELSLVRRGGPRSSVPTAREMIEAQVRTLELEAAGADQALEHRQVFRVHDQAHSALALSYPLMAEGAITGAMRLAVPDEVLARRELAELEEVLQETAGHVGLVVKKDEDVERARHDGLTGLFLKAELLRDLRRELEAAARAGGKLALLMIDIDHFKRVNDAHGHLTGDVVLKGVAGCLAAHVRGEDRAYRYGGEEMAVLLPGADEAAAARTAERLRRAVAELEFHADDGAAVPVTISVGLTNGAQAAADPDEFITRADQALYFSKESGRDRCSRWRPGGPEELPRSGRSGRNPRGRAATPAPRESRAP